MQCMMRNYWARQFFRGLNNGGGQISRDMIAGALEINNYLVSEALWHTANEAGGLTATGAPNPLAPMTLTNPLADSMILYYAPQGPSVDDPSWMYAFRWQNPALPAPMTIFRHRWWSTPWL